MLKEGKLVIGEYRFFQDFFDGQIIKEESEKYKLFKVLLFSVVFAVALFLTFIDIFGIIELALLVFGLVWNIFSGLGKKISYLLCVIVSCLYAIICISFNVYANVLIYLACYIPLQLIATTKDYEDGDFIQIKKHITDYNKILLVLVFISLFMIMIFFDVLTGSRFIIFDALSASLLVCSAVLRNERYFEYYIFRIFALIASVLLWIVVLAEYGNTSAIAVIILYLSYFVFDVVSFITQKLTYGSEYMNQEEKNQKIEDQLLINEKLKIYADVNKNIENKK